MYFPHCGKYDRVVPTLWKLWTFLPQIYINFLTLTIHIVYHLEHFFHWAHRYAGTSKNPSAICQISSASMLAALAQYSISAMSYNEYWRRHSVMSMSAHECTWSAISMALWILMNTNERALALLNIHIHSWALKSSHDHSWAQHHCPKSTHEC